jgi:hypothetical protein
MLVGILRLLAFGFIGLSVVFVLVSVYARSVQREELEKQFDAGGVDGDRDAYIEAGMKAYRRSLRAKLIWLVYVVPMVAFGVLFYILNFG